jgi:hypothetical protein
VNRRCRRRRRGSRCRESRCLGSLWRDLLRLVALAWLVWLLKGLIRFCRAFNRGAKHGGPPSNTVPAWAYRQPDPMIYSQQYLQSLGLAVTWDNPDIHVELADDPGVPIDPHDLKPDTDYVVVARIWNGATTAPAPGLPVKVSYLEFGIGTVRHDVGMTNVDLPAKGAVGCPAFARVGWRTPPVPGHYCLQVQLVWDDDAQPTNNLGQTNTDVKALNSPHATFGFSVRNDRAERRQVVLQADGYAIPPLDPCGDRPDDRGGRLARHQQWAWPIPAGWEVDVRPDQLQLNAGETANVAVDVTSPDGFTGRQAINVRALSGDDLLGGVTLYAEGHG